MSQEKYAPQKGPYPPPDLEKQRFSDKQKTNKAKKTKHHKAKIGLSLPGLLNQKVALAWNVEKGACKVVQILPNPAP